MAENEDPTSEPSARVLIVDDDEELAVLLCMLLERAKLTVTLAHTLSRAIELSETEPFDAVVTDVHLGGGDGLELCRRLQSTRPDVRVVVLTGKPHVHAAARRAGAHAVLTKPVHGTVLVETLTRLFGERDATRVSPT